MKRNDLIELIKDSYPREEDEINLDDFFRRIDELLLEKKCNQLEEIVEGVMSIYLDGDPTKQRIIIDGFTVTMDGKDKPYTEGFLDFVRRGNCLNLPYPYHYKIEGGGKLVKFALSEEDL